MAKAKKPKPRPEPIRTEQAGVFVENFGIYVETSIKAGTPDIKTLVSQEKVTMRKLTAIERLRGLQELLQDDISRYVATGSPVPDPWAVLKVDLGDGPQGYVFAAERSAGVKQAAAVLTTINALLQDNPTEREADIFLRGIEAGRNLEAMKVLPHEPDALIGKRARLSGRAGHEAAYGEQLASHEQIRSEFRALFPAYYSEKGLAYKEVARKHRMNPDAVSRIVRGK